MTEVELAKQLKASNYTCKGVSCDECKKTNYLHVCLMADVRLYCDEILGVDNYINRLEKENEELKQRLEAQAESIASYEHDNAGLKAELELLRVKEKNVYKIEISALHKIVDEIEKVNEELKAELAKINGDCVKEVIAAAGIISQRNLKIEQLEEENRNLKYQLMECKGYR